MSEHLVIVQASLGESQREARPEFRRWTRQTIKGIRGWQAPVAMVTVGRTLLLAWHVSAVQEEPWRRLLQELSDARREEGYVGSRRSLGVSAESVWLVPKPTGGGTAVVYLEALDPERALGELATSEEPFDSWYGAGMRKLFGFDLSGVPRAASGELLFAWRDDGPGEREAPKNP